VGGFKPDENRKFWSWRTDEVKVVQRIYSGCSKTLVQPGSPHKTEGLIFYSTIKMELLFLEQKFSLHTGKLLARSVELFATFHFHFRFHHPLVAHSIPQVHEGVSNAAPPDSPQIILVNNRSKADPLPGSDATASAATDAAHIFEHMCNLKFRLSLSAFFQVRLSVCDSSFIASLEQRTVP
jgi:hypothetical protein